MLLPIEHKYIGQVVRTHLSSFRGFFLSFLGSKFLELFYKGIALSPYGVGFVYVNNSRVEGFVCGAINPHEFFRNLLKKKWLHFSLASFGAILRKPSVIPRLLRAINQPSSSPRGDDKAILMSIGVTPHAQGKGIGKILVKNFLEELKSKGVQEVYLTTDRLNNEMVKDFYMNLGFRLKRNYSTPEGREMDEYFIKL
jgi:ribosomal protein S18 acetylase RimI-like enzyme